MAIEHGPITEAVLKQQQRSGNIALNPGNSYPLLGKVPEQYVFPFENGKKVVIAPPSSMAQVIAGLQPDLSTLSLLAKSLDQQLKHALTPIQSYQELQIKYPQLNYKSEINEAEAAANGIALGAQELIRGLTALRVPISQKDHALLFSAAKKE